MSLHPSFPPQPQVAQSRRRTCFWPKHLLSILLLPSGDAGDLLLPSGDICIAFAASCARACIDARMHRRIHVYIDAKDAEIHACTAETHAINTCARKLPRAQRLRNASCPPQDVNYYNFKFGFQIHAATSDVLEPRVDFSVPPQNVYIQFSVLHVGFYRITC